MKKMPLLVALAVLLFSMTACFQVETRVKLKPDGTGTVEETMMLSDQMLTGMTSMMGPSGGEEGKKQKEKEEIPDLYDPAALKAKAAGMGEGVTFVSGKSIAVKGWRGYKAVYAFKDINKLMLEQNPGKALPGAGAGMTQEAGGDTIFKFVKGPPAKLVIRHPKPKPEEKVTQSTPSAEKPAEAGPASAAEAEALAKMFEGMKFSMVVEPVGDIIETNATHRAGSEITMMDLDFGKLLAKPEQLARLKDLQGASFEDAKDLLKKIPGMKVDLNDELLVTFR